MCYIVKFKNIDSNPILVNEKTKFNLYFYIVSNFWNFIDINKSF